MAKSSKPTKIAPVDLIEYLDGTSDFAFELHCLEMLTTRGYHCQHGGSYTDPATKKTRQFDIRLYHLLDDRRIHCAVECKNLNDEFPLLVLCIPRRKEDSFHQIIWSYDPSLVEQSQPIPLFHHSCQTKTFRANETPYKPDRPVGKTCAQVRRDGNGDIDAKDDEVFAKWAQALASLHDLADYACTAGKDEGAHAYSLLLPVVVVPNGTLWKVEFDATGSRISDPQQATRCSFYVGQQYSAGHLHQSTLLTVSHLEFVTEDGLKSLMLEIADTANSNPWFPLKTGSH